MSARLLLLGKWPHADDTRNLERLMETLYVLRFVLAQSEDSGDVGEVAQIDRMIAKV